jgi:ribose 5-phosphate isomerase B
MKVAIAGDSVGAQLAEVVYAHLRRAEGIEVANLSKAPDGAKEYYANIADRVCRAILAGQFDRGILFCGTGIGMSISANKVPGIRAALTHDVYSAERAAKSNDAHIITLGARVVGPELAKSVVDAWLASEFDPEGPSAANVAAIRELEEKHKAAEALVPDAGNDEASLG